MDVISHPMLGLKLNHFSKRGHRHSLSAYKQWNQMPNLVSSKMCHHEFHSNWGTSNIPTPLIYDIFKRHSTDVFHIWSKRWNDVARLLFKHLNRLIYPPRKILNLCRVFINVFYNNTTHNITSFLRHSYGTCQCVNFQGKTILITPGLTSCCINERRDLSKQIINIIKWTRFFFLEHCIVVRPTKCANSQVPL